MVQTSNDSPTSTTQEKAQKKKRIIIEVVITLVLLVLAIVLCLNWNKLIYKVIYRTVELKPNSEGSIHGLVLRQLLPEVIIYLILRIQQRSFVSIINSCTIERNSWLSLCFICIKKRSSMVT